MLSSYNELMVCPCVCHPLLQPSVLHGGANVGGIPLLCCTINNVIISYMYIIISSGSSIMSVSVIYGMV